MSLTKPIVELIVDRMLDIWETEDNWTQGASARTAEGEDDIEPDSPLAVKWCATGSLAKALCDLRLSEYTAEFEEFMNYYVKEGSTVNCVGYPPYPKYGSVVSFNDADDTTFEDMRLFIKCLKDKDIPAELRGVECDCDYCNNGQAHLEAEECDDDSYL